MLICQLVAGCSLNGSVFRCSVVVFSLGLGAFGLGIIGQSQLAQAEMPDRATQAASTAGSALTSSQSASDDELTWHDNLESGWAEAKRTGRPMVIFITSEECVYCDAMKRDTLCDESVRKRLIARFVPIRLRPGTNNQVLSRVQVTAYPTTLLAHPRGKVITHRVGYQPVAKFHEMLSEIAPADETVLVR